MLKQLVNYEKTAVSLPKATPKSYLILLALLAIALIPYGWVAEMSPLFDRFLTAVFQSGEAHIVGHLLIFALIGTAVLQIFPPLRQNLPLYLTLIVLIGFAQETFQLISFKHRWFGFGELVDLGVDLVGATAVFYLFRAKILAQK